MVEGARLVYDRLSLDDAWSQLSCSDRPPLMSVTTWAGPRCYRGASRIVRRGVDDPRYVVDQRVPGF